MPSLAHLRRTLALLFLAVPISLTAPGCNAPVAPTETTSVPETPPDVLDPQAPEAAPTAAEPAAEPAAEEPQASTTPSLVAPNDLATAATEPAGAAADIELAAMDYETFLAKGAVHPDAKLTMVDAWATWCGPCKENFPHLVEMSEKYGDDGLKVVSLSMDDPGDAKALDDARAFLGSQGGNLTHILLDEDYGVGFEKFDVNTIPAVFLYDPSGREIGRFTIDDPDSQFTYEGVEQVVTALLQGETAPDVPGYYPAGSGE